MRLKDFSVLNPQYEGDNLDCEVSFVPMESLRNGIIDYQTIPFTEGKGNYTFFQNGDLLVAKVTPCFENGNIAIANEMLHGIGFGSSEIFVLRMNKQVLNTYMFYFTQSANFQDSACATMCGVGGLKRISPLIMRTYELDVPPIHTQQRVVNYLDEKLVSINNRLEVLEKQKDAYSRLKKSIIHQAVTRGLNPDVSLIHSGIDSIGMIPKHWEMKRLKDVVSINTKTLPEDTPNSYTFKYIDISNVTNEGVILGGETMSFYEAPSRARRIIERNDVIVSTVRTYLRAIARIDFSTEDIVVSTGFAVLTPNKGMNSVFITYGVRDVNVVDEICKRSTGVSYPAISASRLSAISIPVPPSDEQKDIAAYLDEKCTKIDAIIDNISKQIDASKRLKKALINEVITGQRTI